MKITPLFRPSCFTALFVTCFAIGGNANAQTINNFAGNGTSGFSGDGGPSTAASLSSPNGLAVDGGGNVFVSDGYRLRKINASGIITTIAGNGTGGFTGDGGPSTAAQIEAGAVACDASGNIYLTGGDRIRKINTSGIINTMAGTGTAGFSGDGGPATAAQFSNVAGLRVHGSDIYIADGGNYRVRKINAAGIITTVAGSATSGFSGDGGPATAAQLRSPHAIAFDGSGNMFISDFLNYCVRKVNTSGIITTISGTGGTHGFSGDGGPATAAQMGQVLDIYFDGSNNLYVADWDNSRIRKISSSGIITTIAGNGGSAYCTGDGGPATAASLWAPCNIVVDAANNIYVGDGECASVRKMGNGSTSVSEITPMANTTIEMMPNPNKGLFSLKIITPGDEDVTLHIADVTGRDITKLTLRTNKPTDIQLNVPAGMYYITAETSEGRIVEKIVVE